MAIYSGFYPLKMVISHSYVKLPEGKMINMIELDKLQQLQRSQPAFEMAEKRYWDGHRIPTFSTAQCQCHIFSFLFTVFYKTYPLLIQKVDLNFYISHHPVALNFFPKCTLELLRSSRISPPLPTAPVRCNAPRDPTWCALVFRWPFPSKKTV